MTLAIATTSVPGDLPQKLEAIANAGFQGVELYEPDFTGYSGTPEDLAKLAGDFGIEITLLQPFHDFEGLEAGQRERAFQRLDAKLDLMKALGAKMLLVGSSTLESASDDIERITSDLRELADIANERGVRVAYLALPWARHIKTETDALQIVEAVDRDNFGLGLNSYFSLADGSKPARLRDIPGDRVFHVQLSDAPIVDFDIRHLKRHFGVLPGQGGLNLTGFTRIIAKSGYQGAWSIARVGDMATQGTSEKIASDGYRSLVNLLDDVARTDPAISFDIPELPERVYASGFEFIEFACDKDTREVLTDMLSSLCFRMERRHVSKSVELWRQGAVNIVVNSEKEGFAAEAFRLHGPSVCDMGLRVRDAIKTVTRATALGAPEFSQPVGTGELDIPAIKGVGGNVIHFIDEKSDLHRVWDIEFDPVAKAEAISPAGLRRIDHVAQTMKHEEMQSWMLYFISTFDMKKSSVVDVADPSGVVHSQVIESPEGEVRLNLNGAESQQTFAGSFLADRFGAGVQHIALLSDDIFETSERLETSGFVRLEISPNYYVDLASEFGLDDAFIAQLKAGNILYSRRGDAEYFQIYSAPIFGGFFFEIVQRKRGYEGYGARNASARLAAQMKFLNPEKGTAS